MRLGLNRPISPLARRGGGGIEVWASTNGGDYGLVTTTSEAETSYDYYSYQNATVNVKLKGSNLSDLVLTWVDDFLRISWQKNGTESGFTDPVSISTPLVFKTDQSTPGTLAFNPTGTGMNLPAGKTVNYDWGDGSNSDYTLTDVPSHEYTEAGQYIITISGDTDDIENIYYDNQDTLYGDIGKWVIPSGMQQIRFQESSVTGNLENWILPETMTTIRLQETRITGTPRGELKGMRYDGLDVRDCSLTNEQVESFFSYARSYFESNTPIKNSTFQFTGFAMGSAYNSADDITAIEAAYTAAGYTATITAKIHTVAYGDSQSKQYIPLETYLENSNGIVHPGVVNIGFQWNGYQYWMVDTPYGNATTENPSIWASNDGYNWEVPNGLINPVVPRPTEGGFNNDPDIYFENDVLYVIWNENLLAASEDSDTLRIISSSDGITWGDEKVIYERDRATGGAPSLVKIGETYYIYYIYPSDPRTFRRISCNTVDGIYGNEQICDVPLNDDVFLPSWWHASIRVFGGIVYIAGEMRASKSVYFAKSIDGINFTTDDYNAQYSIDWNTPLDIDDTRPYNCSLMFIGDQLVLYYSAETVEGAGLDKDYAHTVAMNVYLV